MSGQDTSHEIVTEQIIARLEAGTVPWRQPWTAAQAPRSGLTGRPYRGVNVFLLILQGYTSPYWLTFKQINELGGRIRKGERHTKVVFWKILRKEVDSADGDKTVKRIPYLRYFRVWNLDQTEGVTLPPKIQSQIQTQPEPPAPIEAAEKILAGYADAPEIHHGGLAAMYRPTADDIHLPNREDFDTPEDYYSTLFHELGHSTGHPSRLGRFDTTSGGFGSHSYGREELVAEMTAAFLCAEAGIAPATMDDSAAYIASWLRTIREDPRAVVVAAGAAQKAADHILGRIAPDSVDDGEGQ